ncbi:MAG TPA: hypothetical protein PLL64_07165 [Rhodothermales bacterium]|nr:hypothetical protein [Rhodothermales bacterium]HRR08284.1 hypothetical protein [Rhodothermales bacterium]
MQDASPALARSARLIMVSDVNNNKYYHMNALADGTFAVAYGRIGGRATTATYDMALWEKKYHEKIRKGYTDVSYLFTDKKAIADHCGTGNIWVDTLMNRLQGYARRSVLANYLVGSEEVTSAQIVEAQTLINEVVKNFEVGTSIGTLNRQLIRLYALIPRRMTNVRDHLLQPCTNEATISNMLAQEQATLDVMAGQVKLSDNSSQTKQTNLMAMLGIQIRVVEKESELALIRSQMQEHASKMVRVFEVTHLEQRGRFQNHVQQASDQATQLLWHGSRNENWMSILGSGLVLRPSNVIITGKMFGYGLYFADKFKKSLNYSSLSGSFWTGGKADRGYIALYEVHTGHALTIRRHQPWCYQLDSDKLKAHGVLRRRYDSVFAKGGADLLHNEYIVYKEAQNTIKYLIEIAH